jgi:cyclopropane-fatty-acyl-phospholipid synthase
MDQAETTAKKLLKLADIKINGNRPWDIQVLDSRFYKRGLSGSIGFGESYMDGWWESKQMDETIARIVRADLPNKIKLTPQMLLFLARNKFLNVATVKKSYKVGKLHYDVGNELYEKMLDQEMNYTCGYWKGLGDPLTAWKDPKNLDRAQIAKVDLVCRKLGLKKGMKVLDTGCGFGNFARFAAANYGVEVVGCTVSIEQAVKARERCKGLPVKIYHKDYRELKLKNDFDRVASIGIMEHITHKNYDEYLQITSNALKDGGLMLLHTIGYGKSVTAGDPWSEKYIFPNSHLPSIAQIGKAAEGKYVFEDLQNFGLYYYPTLMSWWQNFDKNWSKLKKENPDKYDEVFYRLWKYYLLSFAGAFKARDLHLWQIVLSKNPKAAVYEAVR